MTNNLENPANNQPCSCIFPDGLQYGKFLSRNIGIDKSKGRFGEVSIYKCCACQRLWLHYFVEYEHLSQSARWYRGLITEAMTKTITAENAVEILSNLQWYLYGGSYFHGKYGCSKGQIDVD
ncbi:hypothetical protein H6G06_18465 [Anabaena sphaerica FACHB-251]|uniref:Uncharacterized protein n=1 Tax=Anabaena sphaerica FACHB-251 TaxID=2692883 RepID=A0A927A379_9NOST|nr:hypothetical protein [Anabaena sphaerica]MBD2295400.1 hypothetical protein [Anabaena sphaerica FACHB-251]